MCFYFVSVIFWQHVGNRLVVYSQGLQRGDISKWTNCYYITPLSIRTYTQCCSFTL